MANQKSLYQPWSEEEFSADIDVQSLTHFQRWMYRTLCQKAFVCSNRPHLPNDDELLWKFSGCPSRSFWDQHKGPVRAMFSEMTVDGVKVLCRKRLADDWKTIQRIRESNRKNAQKRWEFDSGQAAGACDRNATAMRPQCDGNATAVQGSNEGSKSNSNSNAAHKARGPTQSELEKEQRDRRAVEARAYRRAEQRELQQAIQVGAAPIIGEPTWVHCDPCDEQVTKAAFRLCEKGRCPFGRNRTAKEAVA